MMSDRARLSNRAAHGPDFLGSKDFPKALIESTQQIDPKALLFGTADIIQSPDQTEAHRLRPLLDRMIKNKRVLVCSGADDKLVPYRCSEPFLKFLKIAAGEKGEGGWYRDGNVYVEDIVYSGAGHEFTDAMKADSIKFVSDTLAGGSGKTSKI
jgi:hypothetical protein